MTGGQLWVPGWLTELFLIVMAVVALWYGKAELATIFSVGACVIGVMRAIEKDRRS